MARPELSPERKEQGVRCGQSVADIRIQNMPSQETYDRGVALAQLVLGDLYTAYLSESKKSMYKHLPNPPPLAAGLKTPLPAALTGDSRTINAEEMAERGEDALEIIAGQIDGSWALGARYVSGMVLVRSS